MAYVSRDPKDDSLENGQNVGSLVCQHCPFRSNSQQILDHHEHHHSKNFSYKCPFCTFTAESTPPILNHIQIVHPEKTDKAFKVMHSKQNCNFSAKKAAPLSTKANVKVAPIGVGPTSIKLKESTGSLVELNSQTRVRPNILQKQQPNLEKMMPQKAEKMEAVDIRKERNVNDNDGGSSTDSDDESKLWCTCRQAVGERFMLCCDGCENWFHGSCVGITPAQNRQMDADGTKWFCPHCIRQNSILNHHVKVTEAMTSLSAQFHSISLHNSGPPKDLLSQPPKGEPPILNTDWFSNNNSEAPSSPPDLQNDGKALEKEESICRMEMEKLVADIRAGYEALVNKANVLKEEESSTMLVSCARKADELRYNINQLEMKNRGESLELAVLIEFKESAQQRLKELCSQKIQLERELDPLKEESTSKKIDLEPSSSDSSEISGLIQQKETLLDDVKIKLVNVLKEESDFTGRIHVVEGELAENARKLAQMRADLDALKDNPTGGLPSANAIQMKTLKMEQCVRIAELSRLERRLVQICCGYVYDEISRKEEEATKAVNDC